MLMAADDLIFMLYIMPPREEVVSAMQRIFAPMSAHYDAAGRRAITASDYSPVYHRYRALT